MHTFQLVGGILILILVKKLFDKRNATTAKGKTEDAATSSSATQGDDSSSSSFPSSSGWDYEVFLSFRGEDTRTNFTDHLYNALVKTGIHTFRDNEGLGIGEKIDPALRSAIHQSKIAIPIFSKNYASSKWCLRELAEIVECMKHEGQRLITVMPVFYHVDPSEVRHQIGCYKNAFQSHQKKYDHETEGWKKALKEVADLKGWDLKNIANGHEAKLIQLIVKEVLNELRKSTLIVSDNLVGIHSHMEEMKKLLNIGSEDIRIVGIHGLGGIGKTTIARCVYNTIYHHFEGSSFLADARETFQTKGPTHLQCQLVTNILNMENPNITCVDQGIDMIRKRLSNKKVLIVVDDVDENIDLNLIIGKRDWFGIGSRIIITTRDRSILDVFGIDNTYEPNEMDLDQSLLLFSKHAFKRDQPPEQYVDLSNEIIKTAGGLPLALEVIGSFLVGKGESAWKDTVKKLKKIPYRKVLEKLRISYDGLDHVEKEMFLDIACFFIRMDTDIACYIWDGCGFFPQIGIEVLRQKSLVKIGKHNELRMHDQLRDLGREIVCQENRSNLGERSRLWLQQEVLDVLNTQKGTGKVEGLCSDFRFCSDCLTSEGFASMTKLRLLRVDRARVAGNFVQSFPELKWLSWKRCPMQFTPTNLRTLAVLDLSHSDITENWTGWNYIKEAVTLKVLDLSWCDKLSRSPNFSANRNLERLILEGCENLVTIDESIGHLKRLVFLDVSFCSSLRCLPATFSALSLLQTLFVKGCHTLSEIGGLKGLYSLQQLIIKNCHSLRKIPNLSDLKNLVTIDISSCNELSEIEGLEGLDSLEKLIIRNCHSLTTIPDLSYSKSLRSMDIGSCHTLSKIEGLKGLYSLEILTIALCDSLRKIPKFSDSKNLVHIDFYFCSQLSEIEGLEGLDSSGELQLHISWCNSLTKINLPRKLSDIRISGCEKLKVLPDVSTLKNLKDVKLDGCYFVERLFDLSNLSKLNKLVVWWLEKLTEMLSFDKLESLEVLEICYCKSLERLPDLSNLTRLRKLRIEYCEKLTEIQGVDRLEILEMLSIRSVSIETLPCLSNLKNLRVLSAIDCKKLTEIQGVDKLESLKVLDVRGCISINESSSSRISYGELDIRSGGFSWA